jgi:ketosteroid isomerase-like protein
LSAAADRNVERVRAGLAAFSRGDYEQALASMHPEIEWHVAFSLPDIPSDKPVYHGRDEVRELWRIFAGGWQTLALEIEEIIAADAANVVARTRFRARGPASEIEVDRVVYYAYAIEDDLLRAIRPLAGEAEALAAAGLGRDG